MTDDVGRLYQRHFEASTWSCGHVAGSCCAECYRELAAKAADLARQIEMMSEHMAHDQSLIADLLRERKK